MTAGLPIRVRGAVALVLVGVVAMSPVIAGAQTRPRSGGRDSVAGAVDSVTRAPVSGAPASRAPVRRQSTLSRGRTPLTPRRAFVYSAILPGLGQSRLDRGTAGALFASAELAAVVMVRRSVADLREARRFRTDSLPAEFTVVDGKLTRRGVVASRYTADLERTRRLHVEDWLAAIAFTHLFAGADAFVAAQLWDMPVQLSALPTNTGAALVATVRF